MATTSLTPAAFVLKWAARFADNEFQNIREKDFREFAADIAAIFGVTVATVPAYKAGTTYQVGFLVRYTPASGLEAFYYALNAGQLTAPGPGNTTDWKVVPGPTTATALSQAITLVQAQGLDGNGVVPGRLYLIECGLDAQGNPQTINVRGVSNDKFDVKGTLEVNQVRTPITDFDVQAGTWQLDKTDSYTKAEDNALLATKQPTILEYVFVNLYGVTTYTLAATYFNKCVSFSSFNPVTVRLPKLTLADVPTTLLLVNDNDPATRPNAVITFRGEHPAASGFVDVLCVLQPGERQPLHITDLPQSASPPALPPPPKPVYVTLGNPAALGAVTPAQLAAVATTLPLTTARTADYTLALADAGCLVPVATQNPVTLTLPDQASVPLPVGSLGYVRRAGSGPLTLAAASGVQLLPPGVGLHVDDYGEVSWHKIDLNTYWLKGSLY